MKKQPIRSLLLAPVDFEGGRVVDLCNNKHNHQADQYEVSRF